MSSNDVLFEKSYLTFNNGCKVKYQGQFYLYFKYIHAFSKYIDFSLIYVTDQYRNKYFKAYYI